MIAVIRAAVLAVAVSLVAVLPAAAQQAPSDPAATPPAVAPPADERQAPDMDAMVQRLKRDLQSLTDAARQGAQSVINRQSPYVISTDQLAAIAAGAVAGAIVIDFMGGGGLATLTGAAIGGVAGHWLYTQPHPMMAPAPNGPMGG